MNKKILMGLLAVAAIAVVATAGTIAFFSDNEVSKDNNFIAGSIDLKVADTNVFTHQASDSTQGGWDFKDLGTTEQFFNFSDLKPGDWGKDTAKLKVSTNDAYVCGNVKLTEEKENLAVDPEKDLGDTDESTGELQNYLQFNAWVDMDCDMQLEEADGDKVIADGLMSNLTLNQNYPFYVGEVKAGDDKKVCIHKKWCFGNWTSVAEGCDGSGEQNWAQTDSVKGDISFYAVQTRHNTQPDCTQIQW